MRTLPVLALVAMLLSPKITWSDESPSRVTSDLLVLYAFDRLDNNLIRDTSGFGEPLDLQIAKGQGLVWRGDCLSVTAATTISSTKPATKIISAIKQSGELTIEAWIKPLDDKQTGPARIISLSADPGQRNFTLGQDGRHFDVRLRTDSTNSNGIPSAPAPEGSVKSELTHVVYCREKSGAARISINGQQVSKGTVAGSLSGWSDEYRFLLVNELTGDRPWRGDLYLVALYSRALTAEQITQNYACGAPRIDYASLLPPAASGKIDFVKDVQPILRQHCYECHAQTNEEGGLNLGVKVRALEGGWNGPVIIPNDSARSRLIHMVAALRKSDTMPPEGDRLSPQQVGILRAWIDQGVQWPESADVHDPRSTLAKEHWAFQPLAPRDPPAIPNETWPITPIDQYILSSLHATKLKPSSRANPQQLLRRIHFNVTGLPPTPAETQDLIAAAAGDWNSAWSALVDRLLQSHHYGERWGRHWLDIARYADSDGQETDRDRPMAYLYRDFVIRALNDDMPFDQFVRWQLAGNEYEPENPAAVAATGFLTAGPFAALGDNLMEDERLRNRYNELDDIVSTIGTGMLGLTLGCVRCHDHKYDAIPARDYYGLLSAMQSGDRGEVTLGDTKVFAYRDSGSQPKPSWLFRRGDYYDHEHPISLGFVGLLTHNKTPSDYWKQAREAGSAANTTFQRRAIAEWMTDVQNGAGALVARVIVNRIWQHHFGSGIVRSVGDFGVRSDAPTHPELLDWLAQDLIAHGWKLKRLHRLILTSAVYQQQSQVPSSTSPQADAAKIDPDDRLLWRMRVRRLDAEILRDSMLAVSGTLNTQTYGPGFKPPISSEAIVARNTKDPYPAKVEDSPNLRRRSVYMFHKRVVPYPFLQAFDKPDAQQSCSRREPTTVAPQALALLNDQFVRNVSLDFADRLRKEGPEGAAQWVERGYQIALSRPPTESERAASLAFLETQIQERTKRSPTTSPDEIQRRSLADLCQAWFSLNEFLYVD